MLEGQNISHTVLLLLPAPQHCWQVDGMQRVVEDAPVLAGCCQGPDCPRGVEAQAEGASGFTMLLLEVY